MVIEERQDPHGAVRLRPRAPRERHSATTDPRLQRLAAGPAGEPVDHHQGRNDAAYIIAIVSLYLNTTSIFSLTHIPMLTACALESTTS